MVSFGKWLHHAPTAFFWCVTCPPCRFQMDCCIVARCHPISGRVNLNAIFPSLASKSKNENCFSFPYYLGHISMLLCVNCHLQFWSFQRRICICTGECNGHIFRKFLFQNKYDRMWVLSKSLNFGWAKYHFTPPTQQNVLGLVGGGPCFACGTLFMFQFRSARQSTPV